nr:AraC family transcriptional regulator [Jannaschia sp. S6380]
MGEFIAACGHGLPAASALDDIRLARAVDYAETHIAAPLTMGELARAAAMSASAFSRAFKASTGETPWAYIRRRRLQCAGERLARTDDTLAQIAEACGFADASHLARCWRQAHGRTPREARQFSGIPFADPSQRDEPVPQTRSRDVESRSPTNG